MPVPLQRFRGALRQLRGTAGLDRVVLGHEVRTPRLLLRPYRMTDEPDWRRIEDDESVRLGLNWPIRTESEVRAHLRDRTRHIALSIPGDLLVLAVERSGTVIGDVSLHLRTTAPETRTAEIGWLQLSAACGHGYATEAARAMLGVAFEELDACLVTAVIHRTNTASVRLARRLGFRPAGGTDERETFILVADDWWGRGTTVAAPAEQGTTE